MVIIAVCCQLSRTEHVQLSINASKRQSSLMLINEGYLLKTSRTCNTMPDISQNTESKPVV